MNINEAELQNFFKNVGVFQTAQIVFRKLFGNQISKDHQLNATAPEPLSDEKEDTPVSTDDTVEELKIAYQTRKQKDLKDALYKRNPENYWFERKKNQHLQS